MSCHIDEGPVGPVSGGQGVEMFRGEEGGGEGRGVGIRSSKDKHQ